MKKHLYELTNEELEKYVDTPEVQRLLNFVNSYTKPVDLMIDSYNACVKMKVLYEQQIEVQDND